MDLWRSICLPRNAEDAPLLLMPEEYELLNPSGVSGTLVELLQAGILCIISSLHKPAFPNYLYLICNQNLAHLQAQLQFGSQRLICVLPGVIPCGSYCFV